MNRELTTKFFDLIAEMATIAKQELNDTHEYYIGIIETNTKEIVNLNMQLSVMELRIQQIEKMNFTYPELILTSATRIEKTSTIQQPIASEQKSIHKRPYKKGNPLSNTPAHAYSAASQHHLATCSVPNHTR